VFEHRVEFLARWLRCGDGEGEATARTREGAGPANELVAQRAKRANDEEAGPCWRRATASRLRSNLKFAAEVVRECPSG